MNILREIAKLPELIRDQIIAYYLWEFTQDNYFSRTPWDQSIKDDFRESYELETRRFKSIANHIFKNHNPSTISAKETNELTNMYNEAKEIQKHMFKLESEPMFCKVCHSTITKGYYLKTSGGHQETKKHQKNLKAIYDMHYNLKYTPDKYFISDSQYERYLKNKNI
jgi:hypothetical protein